MPDQNIILEYRDNIAIVTLNRPDKRNAFDQSMWKSLEKTIEELEKKLPRAIVITGAGDKAFSAGFDVNPGNPQVGGLIEAVKEKNLKPIKELVSYIRKTTGSFTALPVPIIAAINGIAYGGGAELAVQCDMRVMDPAAEICFSEVKLGLIPDWGGGVALTRLCGRAVASDLILTARKINADEALNLGLINRISAKGSSLDEAIFIAEGIAKNGPLAIRSALKIIRESGDLTLSLAFDMETDIASALIASGECVHGITAFLSKKEPVFPDPE